ncbi:hypothetical protein ACIQGZ_13940 [Streptomyces sp. NPDC092296]|uniref:hypothetical protein n=1 Tax=Streptomyces sp. NPDC092296 TaxID=3366012 RepID=UPI0037F17C4C
MNTTDQHPIARPVPLRQRRSARSTAGLLIAAAALVVGATACSGSTGAAGAAPAAGDAGASAPAATATPESVESVSAEVAAARAAAAAELKTVQGQGNAVGDITLSGVPASTAHGHPAATVKISNHSGRTASYAVLVDFVDASGKTVESTVTALHDLGDGQTATLLTFGTKSSRTTTTPKVAKAQRS